MFSSLISSSFQAILPIQNLWKKKRVSSNPHLRECLNSFRASFSITCLPMSAPLLVSWYNLKKRNWIPFPSLSLCLKNTDFRYARRWIDQLRNFCSFPCSAPCIAELSGRLRGIPPSSSDFHCPVRTLTDDVPYWTRLQGGSQGALRVINQQDRVKLVAGTTAP